MEILPNFGYNKGGGARKLMTAIKKHLKITALRICFTTKENPIILPETSQSEYIIFLQFENESQRVVKTCLSLRIVCNKLDVSSLFPHFI